MGVGSQMTKQNVRMARADDGAGERELGSGRERRLGEIVSELNRQLEREPGTESAVHAETIRRLAMYRLVDEELSAQPRTRVGSGRG